MTRLLREYQQPAERLLTMVNLEAVRDEIKAAAVACDGTPTAKFVAVLVAAGITDTKDIAAILGVGERAVQKVRKANSGTPNHSSPNQSSRTTVRNEPQDANHSSEPNHSSPKSEPQFGSEPRVRARIETPSGLLSQFENLDSPQPPKGPTPRDALTAFEAYNATALRCGLPQAAKLTPDRQRKIIARLRDYGLDGWRQALANIERSSFLTGGTKECFRADLDFMVQPKSFGKLHDGGYGNGRHAPAPATARSPVRWIAPTPEELRAINA
jgi:hypothetical protein